MVARADLPPALHLEGPFQIQRADIGPLNVLFSETFTERYRRDGLVGVRVPPLNPTIWQYAVADAGEGGRPGPSRPALPVHRMGRPTVVLGADHRARRVRVRRPFGAR